MFHLSRCWFVAGGWPQSLHLPYSAQAGIHSVSVAFHCMVALRVGVAVCCVRFCVCILNNLTMLWNCIGSMWIWIRIRIPYFWSMRIRKWIRIKILGFDDQKLENIYSWKKNNFGSKSAIFISLGSIKNVQTKGEGIFFTFVGHFCPPRSGSVLIMRIRIQPTKMNADPDL